MHYLGRTGPRTTTVRVLLGLLRKTAARRSCSAATRGATRSRSTDAWRTCRGGEPLAEPDGWRGDRPAREAARRPRSAARRAARALPARPDEEDPRLLEGQPAEGGARRGLASDVELYLLDEPTSGLDPDGDRLPGRRSRAARPGRTALSSHILAEVEALCDRVTIIRAGRAADPGTFGELRHLTRTTVVVETAKPIGTLSELRESTTRESTARVRSSASTPAS